MTKTKTLGRSEPLTLSWSEDVVPFVGMLTITCLDMAVLTVVKAAMNDGLGSIVYVIYHNALGTFILLPFFILHFFRNVERPPLTVRILFRFFILGLVGLCLFQVLLYLGVSYSSPTMASAISNLAPGVTFLIAVFFRIEKIDRRSSSSVAKLLGTIIAISGAMVFTLYQGPNIFHTIHTTNPFTQPLLSQPPKWVLGGLIVLTGGTFGCLWNVLQTITAREYPDHQTIVFFYCLFGTIQCIAISPFIETNPSAWVLRPGIGMIAVVLGAVYSTVIHNNIVIWCLRKKGPVFVSMFSPLSIVIAVIMGVTFLGDSVYLGSVKETDRVVAWFLFLNFVSVIGSTIVAVGFYTVMWGQANEKNKLHVAMVDDLHVADELGSSSQHTPLLSSLDDQLNC